MPTYALCLALATAMLGAFIHPALAAPTPPPAPAKAPSGAKQPAQLKELVDRRTKNSKLSKTADGRFVAEFAPNLHYEASPGKWERVDLSFRRTDHGWLADRNRIKVKATADSIQATDQAGRGIRWATPGLEVSGSKAFYSKGGLFWEYQNRPSGLKLTATVQTTQSKKSYEFSYSPVGGAKALAASSAGGVNGDGFQIPPAEILGADGKTYAAGPWKVTDNTLSFDFDDSGLPKQAFPYVIDPTTIFGAAASEDDGTVWASSEAYPPVAPTLATAQGSLIDVVRSYHNYSGLTDYEVQNGLIRFDTSALPDDANISSVVFRSYVVDAPSNANNRSLTADWFSTWPVGLHAYSPVAQTGALAGQPLSSLTPASDNDIVLDNAAGISTTSYTGLRLHISGDQPTGENDVTFASFDSGSFAEPRLVVTYTPAVTPSISIGDAAAGEDSGQVVLPVTLSPASPGPVTVEYDTADATATATSGDYIPAKGILSFSPGETTKTIEVRVNFDANSEPDEHLFVNLSGATGAAIADTQGKATIHDGPAAASDTTGLEEFYPYQRFEIGNGSAFANMATGNLVMQNHDFDIPGQGLNLRLTRTYNLNRDSENGPLGKGWTLGLFGGETSGSLVDNVFYFTDADGTKHTFIKQSPLDLQWRSPPGINLVLTDGIDLSGKFLRLTRPDGVSYEFRLISSAYRLNRVVDRKGNHLNFSYSGTQLSTVTDVKGRTLTFTWAGSYLSKARIASGSSFIDTDYTVNSSTGRLTSVTEAAGTSSARTTNYGYASSYLSSVTDPRSNATNFSVGSGKLNQVTDRAGKNWSLSYNTTSCQPTAADTSASCLTDPEGNKSVWTILNNNLIDQADPGDKNEAAASRVNHRQYVWSGNRLGKQIDEDGDVTEYEYNANGQITQSRFTGAGEAPVVSRFVYAQVAAGVADLTEANLALGTPDQRNWRFEYDGLGSMTRSVDPTGAATTFTHFERGLLRTVTDPNGNVTRYGNNIVSDGDYHASGQPSKITDATGKTKFFVYDFLGRNTQVTDREAKIWNFEFDLRGNPTRQIDPLGRSTFHCFDLNDNETLVIRPKQATQNCTLDENTAYVTKKSYEARDLLASVRTKSDTQLRKTVYNYYDDGELKEILQPRSFDASTGAQLATLQKATYLRYPNNRVSGFKDEEGNQSDVIYTPGGQPRVVTDPPNSDAGTRHSMTYTYSGKGEVATQLESGHSQPTVYSYNPHGERTLTKTPKSNTTVVNYDKMGRVTATINAEGRISTRNYDPAGNLIALSQPTGIAASTTVNYTYTPRNEIATETDPADAAHTIAYSYDGEGRQRFKFDKYAGVTERTQEQIYLNDGKLAEKIASFASGTTGKHRSVFAYDQNGNQSAMDTYLDSSATPNVSSISSTYTTADELKTLAETIYPPTGAGVTRNSSYAYAQDGLLTNRTVDGKSTSYDHFRNGLEKTATPWAEAGGPGGPRAGSHPLPVRLPHQIDDSTSGWGSGSFESEYFPSGGLKKRWLPNGMFVSQTYDAADRMASKVADCSHVLARWQTVYDDDDNRTSEVVQTIEPFDTRSEIFGTATFSYDRLGRLTAAQGPFETKTIPYVYDDAGNVVSETEALYSYQNNRLASKTQLPSRAVSSFSYDHFGNQTTQTTSGQATSSTYDAASHTRRVTSPDGTWVEYAYDGLDRQVRRQESSGAVTLFFRDQLTDQISLETNSTGATPTRYILDSQGEPVASESPTGRGTYLTDPRGNLTHVFDKFHAVQATYAYDPFGKQRATGTTVVSGWDSRLKFQMAPQDPKTKSYSIGPRIFNPDIYRFAGADNFVASASNLDLQIDPLTGNRYLYAGSNPANMIDDGHAPKFCNEGLGKRLCQIGAKVSSLGAKATAAVVAGKKIVRIKGEGIIKGAAKPAQRFGGAVSGVGAGVLQAASDYLEDDEFSPGQRAGRAALQAGIGAASFGVGILAAGACGGPFSPLAAACGIGAGAVTSYGLNRLANRHLVHRFGLGRDI